MSEEESSQKASKEKMSEPLPPVEHATTPTECYVPPSHVKEYGECCEKYTKGEMSDLEVMGKVIDTLGRLRKSKE